MIVSGVWDRPHIWQSLSARPAGSRDRARLGPQGLLSHILALEAPLAALAVDRLSIRAAFAVWALIALTAVAWIAVVARSRRAQTARDVGRR